MTIKLNAFTTGYLECALWCGVYSYTDDGEIETSDDLYDADDLPDEIRSEVEADCASFVAANIFDLMDSGLSSSEAGHCFYLARNRHGAGFIDYSGDVFDRLLDAARVYGSQSFIADEDGRIVEVMS